MYDLARHISIIVILVGSTHAQVHLDSRYYGVDRVEMSVNNRVAEGITTFTTRTDGVHIEVEMEIYNVFDGTYDDCISDDGKYIMMNWYMHAGKPDGGQGVGDECGPNAGHTPVGGKYDPTFVCSSSTDNIHKCTTVGRTKEQGFNYHCSPTEYEKNSNTCEVGDYSGKFGLLQFHVNHRTKTAYAEYGGLDQHSPPLHRFLGRSMVLHCNARRLVCGAIEAPLQYLEHNNKSCRGMKGKNDNSKSYYDLITASPENCLLACKESAHCTGYETGPKNRCELWKKLIGFHTMKSMKGHICNIQI
eukprot:CFRG7237T1